MAAFTSSGSASCDATRIKSRFQSFFAMTAILSTIVAASAKETRRSSVDRARDRRASPLSVTLGLSSISKKLDEPLVLEIARRFLFSWGHDEVWWDTDGKHGMDCGSHNRRSSTRVFSRRNGSAVLPSAGGAKCCGMRLNRQTKKTQWITDYRWI